MSFFKKRGEHSKESKIKGNSLGASGFTLGILSIIFAGFYGIPFSIVGFIFCFIQQRKKPTKLGKAGLILSVIGLILSLIWVFYLAPIFTSYIQSKAALVS